ncbi:DASH complex subunit ask1 [Leucoagaricus sp. SymC.cos]|nr:DASH complex subunit ask1 [Leucoagaricus sp. SymC.cos]
MLNKREDIALNPPRWNPNPNPTSIQVPGLDTSAPVHDQIEQIEQLITIKLQNIDENFSKIHHVLASKLLPAVKRYAVGTEPVREAAKFWTSFYEQAAQIRIPTSDDHSTVNDFSSQNELSSAESEHTTQDETVTERESEASQEASIDQAEDPSVATTESSFHPNQDAFSSTPATARVTRIDESTAQSVQTPPWSASLESPFVRLSNEVKKFSLTDDDPSFAPSTAPNSTLLSDEPTPAPKSIVSHRSSRKEKNTPLRENLLRHQLYSASDTSSIAATSKNISPLKPRGSKPKTPIPKNLNPYIPAGTDSRKWDGVVDLRDPSTTTPRRSRRTHPSSPRKASTTPKHISDDEDDLPPGMSPPVMLSPVRFQKPSDHSLLAPTPLKGASARITQDILRSVQKGRQYDGIHSVIESSLSTMPSPPSFSQYQDRGPPDITDSLTDPSFDSMMRRVGLEGLTSSDPGPSTLGRIVDDSARPAYNELDSDDSMDDFNPTAHPSAAFLMATRGMRAEDEDSFGSSNQSTDSLNDEEAHLEGAVPVHPFAGGIEDTGDDDSDSFEDFPQGDGAQTETLFGVPPGQRRAAGQQGGQPLRMLGQEMLDDVTATGAYIGGVEESPTPAGWGN